MTDDYRNPGIDVPPDLLAEAGLAAPVDPYAGYDRDKLVELAERGKPFGLSPAEVEAADTARMELDEYVVMQGADNLADVEAGMERLRRDRAARTEAEHQRAVERARRAT